MAEILFRSGHPTGNRGLDALEGVACVLGQKIVFEGVAIHLEQLTIKLDVVPVGAARFRRGILERLDLESPGRTQVPLLHQAVELLGECGIQVEPLEAGSFGIGQIGRDELMTHRGGIQHFLRENIGLPRHDTFDHAEHHSKPCTLLRTTLVSVLLLIINKYSLFDLGDHSPRRRQFLPIPKASFFRCGDDAKRCSEEPAPIALEPTMRKPTSSDSYGQQAVFKPTAITRLTERRRPWHNR